MCAKEWMELIIPIVADGILLWGAQFLIAQKIERRNEYELIKNEVYNKNLKLIEEGISTCRKLRSVMVNSSEDERIPKMAKLADKLQEDFRILYYFYKDYHIIIDEDTTCKEAYVLLNGRFIEALVNWSDGDNNILLDFIRDSEDLLHDIMDATLKHIYKIK